MPAVFVHGVPDTQQVWDAVIARLHRKDAVPLSLPGFGCPLSQGFSATKEAYVDWLLAELAALPGPIDLVGTIGAVSSWCAPCRCGRAWYEAGQRERRRWIGSTCGIRPREPGRRQGWARR